ncbi:MAG TPA: hypothetical protein DCE52_03280 [Rhodobacteraceae bacterium]|nr:hypothetical protein [Paracoccaceae bacterium]
MRCYKPITLILLLCLCFASSASSAASRAELDRLYESIGYYSSAHDVLVWFSLTAQCRYIFTTNNIPSLGSVSEDILAAMPIEDHTLWGGYLANESTKRKYLKSRQIIAELYGRLTSSGTDTRTACGIISAKLIDEFGRARRVFSEAALN